MLTRCREVLNNMSIDVKITDFTQGLQVPSRVSKEDAWEKLGNRLTDVKKSKRESGKKLKLFIGSAAAAAVFLTILSIGMFNTGKYSPDISTGISEAKPVILPDSTSILLNSNSLTRYHYNRITGERNVFMKGEALFDVKKGRKFTVELENARIHVRGTSFNVIAYSQDYLKVQCLEGSVDVSVNKTNINLEAGEALKYMEGNLRGAYLENTDHVADHYIGVYYWEKVKLKELLEIIGYRFAYEMKYPENLPDRHFSGKIDLSNLYNGLNIVSYAMDLKYVVNKEEQTITVHAR